MILGLVSGRSSRFLEVSIPTHGELNGSQGIRVVSELGYAPVSDGPPMTPATLGRQAVVLGAGMAGLFSARILSDYFDQVVVLDRDDLPDGPRPRAGVPQDRHLHTMLPGGLEIACSFFPGLAADLEVAGAVRSRFGQDLIVFRPEGTSYLAAAMRSEPLVTGIIYYSMSRSLFEHVVRRRVMAIPNVLIHPRSPVRRPLVIDGAVVGVILESGDEVHADLVIDASGRAARSISWLGQLGYEAPAESVVACDFAYASAVLRPSDPVAIQGSGVLVLPDPASDTPTRGGYLVRIEDNLWMAGLAGRFGDFPPVDPEAWRAFGRSLTWPGWDDLVGAAELVSAPSPFRFPRSVRRHFERLEFFPEGLVPLGDAVCHINPVYGQGMSAAACQVRALGNLLERRSSLSSGLLGIAREFFPMAAETTRTPWALAAGSDFLDSRTTGDFPEEELDGLLRYVQLGTLVESDSEAADLFLDIYNLRRPLSVLGEPPWPERLAAEHHQTSISQSG